MEQAEASGAIATDRVSIEVRKGEGREILGVVRASSWGDAADCAYRWYSKAVLGMRLPSGPATVVGSAIHKGTAPFDAARLVGMPFSVEAATEVAYASVMEPRDEEGKPEDVNWQDEDDAMGRGAAADLAVGLVAKYCQVVAPTLTYTAVEVKCTKLDVQTDYGLLRMTGTTDRIEKRADGEGIADFKSGKKAVEGITSPEGPRAVTKGHGLQVGAYTIMSEVETGRKMGAGKIIGFQANSKLHIAQGIIDHPKRALVGTNEQPGLIEIVAGYLKSGLFPPNPKSILCSKKWCPMYERCIYHD